MQVSRTCEAEFYLFKTCQIFSWKAKILGFCLAFSHLLLFHFSRLGGIPGIMRKKQFPFHKLLCALCTVLNCVQSQIQCVRPYSKPQLQEFSVGALCYMSVYQNTENTSIQHRIMCVIISQGVSIVYAGMARMI